VANPEQSRMEDGAEERWIRVSVERSDPESPREFQIRYTPPAMVMDLLLEIQSKHDPTLAFRRSCRVAVCNACGMLVNGERVLACGQTVGADVEHIEIEALNDEPVIKDLITDTDQLRDPWA
jgi:succinate dehydrogenase / fumarate reductase, iron-sulfur subunit